jgi:Zn-dependent peptidase ImmA (M78 family)/DNA-binding XRE family transcriptional regulator
VNVNLIAVHRDAIGWSQQQLGEAIGVTRQTIATWESGERSPPVTQLAKIASTLRVSLEALLGIPDEQIPSLLFRADEPEALTPAIKSILVQKAENYAQLEQLLNELPLLPESRPAEMYTDHAIEDVALEIRDWLGVEKGPLGDVLALLEDKGLKIIRASLPNRVSGFSAYTDSWGGVIFVNTQHPTERQYFTCLHELGHLILHRREYRGFVERVKRGDLREKAVNHLAGAILLPRAALERELYPYRNRWIPEPLLADIKRRYWVSMRTVLYRASDRGLISKQQCGQQLGVLNRDYGKDAEPVELPRLNEQRLSRFERLSYRALLEGKITVSRGAELLGKPVREVRAELKLWQATEGS